MILASASPRRKALMELTNIPFDIVVPDICEEVDEEISPYDRAKLIAYEKARAVARQMKEDAIIIGADTLIDLQGKLLIKPSSTKEAGAILKKLQGRKHQVYTGLSVIQCKRGQLLAENLVSTATVYMAGLTDAEIEAYVATNEPMDKAGAYAIQQKAAFFIDGIEGDYYTVVGLPLHLLYKILQKFGVEMTQYWK